MERSNRKSVAVVAAGGRKGPILTNYSRQERIRRSSNQTELGMLVRENKNLYIYNRMRLGLTARLYYPCAPCVVSLPLIVIYLYAIHGTFLS